MCMIEFMKTVSILWAKSPTGEEQEKKDKRMEKKKTEIPFYFYIVYYAEKTIE